MNYNDSANPDRLTSYKGKSITYDANGGVATYDGCDYSWSKGKLSTIYKALGGSSRAILPTLQSSQTYSFGYNGLGQRVSSGYNYVNISSSSLQMGELTAYNKKFSYDHSGRLIYETNTKTYYQEGSETYEIVYLYDDSGVVGMAYTKNNVTSAYYFQKNLMGDVVAIYDTNGAKIASYNYDAWGNCTIASNTTNYTIAHANPFRYRGYYYDTDTGLYYLNARYYSPEFRRFISPDDTEYLNPKNVNGLNLYCYCNNDPINFVDPSGHSVLMSLGVFGFFATAIAVVGLVLLAPVLIVVAIFMKIDDAITNYKTQAALDTKPSDQQYSSSVNPGFVESTAEGLMEYGVTAPRKWFPIGNSNQYQGTFGNSGGGSLWDPVLQLILNESFTGSFR